MQIKSKLNKETENKGKINQCKIYKRPLKDIRYQTKEYKEKEEKTGIWEPREKEKKNNLSSEVYHIQKNIAAQKFDVLGKRKRFVT